MIFGVDIHPTYQAGINIEQIHAEGFDFMAVKLSEATATFGGLDWLRRGAACGLLCLGYHYLRPGNEAQQAAVFAQQLAAAGGIPGMLDAEAVTAVGGIPTLTVAGIHRFLDACATHSARVPLIYLPRWYWQRMGSPDLSGLPMLWASSYVNGSGFAADLYESVTPSKWKAYGNLPVAVLQFTDRAEVAGQTVDADVFFGTRDQFAALIGSNPPQQPPGDIVSIQLPPTDRPGDIASDPATWPQREEVVALGYVKGWQGRHVIRISPGNPTGQVRNGPGGYLFRAHVDYPLGPGKGVKLLNWINPDAKQSTPLFPPYCAETEYMFEPGDVGSANLMITYAAPAGLSLDIEHEK